VSDTSPENQLSAEALLARLNQNPTDFDAAVTLGNMYFDNNEAAQAIVYYRIALDIDPNQPGVRTDMGTMYWRNGNVAQSEQAFRHVIQQHPGFGNAYLNLGYLLLHAKGKAKEARVIWLELVENYPQEPASEKVSQLLQDTNH